MTQTSEISALKTKCSLGTKCIGFMFTKITLCSVPHQGGLLKAPLHLTGMQNSPIFHDETQ